MVSKKHKLSSNLFPKRLLTIPQPPKQLFVSGPLAELLDKPVLAVIGSRKMTAYGKQITEQLVTELARKGVVIVSGLAIGVDGCAHKACLGAGGKTIAVLPSGLDMVYPRMHELLARQITEQGGALVSEYPDGSEPFKTNFIARNRIIAGLADAVLVTEAAEKSGSLYTANFALEQGKTVFAVPGNVTSYSSMGTNQLLKTGAILVTETGDITDELGVKAEQQTQLLHGDTPEETAILTLLQQGISDGHELMRQSKLAPEVFNQALSMLEINGYIKPLGTNHWTVK